MELFGELFLTASLALFLSFLVAKLVAVAMAGGDSDCKSAARVSDEGFVEALRVQGCEAERKVEFVEEALGKVDHLREVEAAEESQLREEEISEEQSETVGVSRETMRGDVRADGSDGGSSRKGEAVVLDRIAAELATNGVVSSEQEEVRVSREKSEGKEEANEDEVESRRSIGEEDDWEGIEKNELESDFAAAMKFVDARARDGYLPANVLGSDVVQMELYGLRKVATEGTCHEPLPPALDLSDRAKWNAWQRLGNMTPEKAMEQYITILSENVPGWMEDHFAGENKQECLEEKAHHTVAPAFSTNEREPELESYAKRVDFNGASNLENRASG